jgi:hypothetical protein
MVDFYNPHPDTIVWSDIAHALGSLARFNGHTKRFYSVAEHSVMVARMVPPADALWGLVHDAAEAYIGDIVSPVKHLCPEVDIIERRLMGVICDKLGLPHKIPASVVEADARMLATEARDLLIGDVSWCKALPYDDEVIEPEFTNTPQDAAIMWIRNFEHIVGTPADPMTSTVAVPRDLVEGIVYDLRQGLVLEPETVDALAGLLGETIALPDPQCMGIAGLMDMETWTYERCGERFTCAACKSCAKCCECGRESADPFEEGGGS